MNRIIFAISLAFSIASSQSFGQTLDCWVSSGGQAISFQILDSGAQRIITEDNEIVVVGARRITWDDCAERTCFALAVGLAASEED